MTVTPQFLINGQIQGHITPLDRGFAYGDGVFRTLPLQGGRPVCWDLHYSKLLEDCQRLAIECPAAELLLADIERLADADELRAVIKIVITRGEGARGYALPETPNSCRVVIKSTFPAYGHSDATHGVRLHLCRLRLGHQPMLAGIKHLNRLENVLARMEWSSPEIADGLLLDVDGNAIECTASNLFVRYGDRLLTPDLSQCGVAGVTRQRIISLASQLGLAPDICQLPLAELMAADEVIICNSLFGAWQVTEFNGKTWPSQALAKDLRNLLLEQI